MIPQKICIGFNFNSMFLLTISPFLQSVVAEMSCSENTFREGLISETKLNKLM